MTDHPDRLSLRGMRFVARHGVLPKEKVEPQRFEIDVVLHADLARAAETDALDDTIDYSALHELVAAIVTGPSFDLIEALGGAIARAVLAATDAALVDAVEVRVRKPDAPIDGGLDTVEAALFRRRLD
jgi:dihydroneopterin aldolase